MTSPLVRLDRDDIVAGLRDVVLALDATGEEARIRIVGGAAISLAYNAARGSTVDIDALLTPREAVLDVARGVGAGHGWPADWFNDAARIFVPEGFGRRGAEWTTIAAVGRVEISVASAETLLAMKLKATIRRGLRELDDLRILLGLTGVVSVDAAEDILDAFYPADGLTDRAREIVQVALDTAPQGHVAPEVPRLT